MDFEFNGHRRVAAPLELVWEELDSLDQILSKTPQAFTYEVVPGGREATVQAIFSWGPVKWTVEMQASLEEYVPPERTLLVIHAPSLDARYRLHIQLQAVGGTATKLLFGAQLDCGHRFAARMHGLLGEIMEEHVCGVVSRVQTRAEQRRRAQERLLR